MFFHDRTNLNDKYNKNTGKDYKKIIFLLYSLVEKHFYFVICNN